VGGNSRSFLLLKCNIGDTLMQKPGPFQVALQKRALHPAVFCGLVIFIVLGLALLASSGLGAKGLDQAGTYLLYAGLFWLALIQALLLGYLLGFTKLLLLAGEGVIVRSTLILLSLMLLIIAGIPLSLFALSWFSYYVGLGFLNFDVLITVLDELRWIFRSMTALEVGALSVGSIVALTLSLVFLIFSPIITSRRAFFIYPLFLGISVLLSTLTLRFIPSHMYNDQELEQFQNAAIYSVSPELTFFWGGLFFYDYDQIEPVDLELNPRELPAAFAARIEPDLNRPNIIVFVMESMRADIVGKEIDGKAITPNINQLAETGANFKRAYAQSNESALAISAMTTGLYSFRYRSRYELSRKGPPILPFYELLSYQYRTAYFYSGNAGAEIGQKFTQTPGLEIYFDANHVPCEKLQLDSQSCLAEVEAAKVKGGNLDDAITSRYFNRWISLQHSNDGDKPFFAFVAFEASHFPYELTHNPIKRFNPSDLSPADWQQISFIHYPRRLKEVMQNRFYNSLYYSDRMIGETIELLKDRQLLDNTIIIVTADHGQLFHEKGLVTHGGELYEPVIHVPFIISGRPLEMPVDTETPIMHIDLAPTVLSLARFPVYEGFQGQDILSQKNPLRPILVSNQGYGELHALIVWPWKYLRNKQSLAEELFNLEADPDELNNLIDDQTEIYLCLKNELSEIRNTQLYFYSEKDLYRQNFPPRFAIPHCMQESGDLN